MTANEADSISASKTIDPPEDIVYLDFCGVEIKCTTKQARSLRKILSRMKALE